MCCSASALLPFDSSLDDQVAHITGFDHIGHTTGPVSLKVNIVNHDIPTVLRDAQPRPASLTPLEARSSWIPISTGRRLRHPSRVITNISCSRDQQSRGSDRATPRCAVYICGHLDWDESVVSPAKLSRILMYKHSRFCPYRVPLASLQSLDRPRKRQRMTGIGVFGLYSCPSFLGTQAWRGVPGVCPVLVPKRPFPRSGMDGVTQTLRFVYKRSWNQPEGRQ